MYRLLHARLVLLMALALAGATSCGETYSNNRGTAELDSFTFEGSRAEAEQFIRYYESIQLTAQQEAVRKQALQSVPAPCCSTFSAATCCCECNLSRTIWGLSKYLIAQEGRSAEEVRTAATEWVDAINPSGYAGDTCFTGGCGRSFKEGGCGGMRAEELLFD